MPAPLRYLGIASQSFTPVCLLIMTLVLQAWPGASILRAQTALGDLTGVVTDKTGAVIPGVTLNVTNEATQGKRTAATDDSGFYRVDGLLQGEYTIEAEKTGFKKFARPSIRIKPAQLIRIDIVMEVGDVREVVEVRDTAPTVIQADSPSLSTNLPTEFYSERPITNEFMKQGYLFSALIWVPGSATGDSMFSFAGNRFSMTRNNVEGLQGNQFRTLPPMSIVKEASVVLSNAPAEYTQPVTAEATFKSGTNRLSGEWITNFQNPCTDAKSTPFSNPGRVPCVTTWRNFGSVGGPVWIPKVYDGRNKTFFFFTRTFTPDTIVQYPVTATVPTLAMQAGDFSRYPRTVRDPRTGQPFPGNRIPAERISQLAKGVIQDYYESTYQYIGSPDNFSNNAFLIGPDLQQDKRYAMKFDHNLGTKDIFSFSFDHLAIDHPFSEAAASGRQLNSYRGTIWRQHMWSLAETHVFTPRIVNQMRVGVTRFRFASLQVGSLNNNDIVYGSEVVRRWGIGGIPSSNFSGSPVLNITNWNTLFNDNQNLEIDGRYQFYDNVSIRHGAHSFKTGFSLVKLNREGTAARPYFGNFTFNGLLTGEPWADFLLGLPSSFSRTGVRPDFKGRYWELGGFFQDDFKVSPRLTLFYGLRWERYRVPYDAVGLYYNFDPKTFSVVVPDQSALEKVSPAWPSATFPVRLAKDAGFPKKLFTGSNNFLPRLGFAWRPYQSGDMVVRGGYGVYIGIPIGQLQVAGPFAVTENFINALSPNSPSGALYAFPNPFPPTVGASNVASINAFDKDIRDPYSQNWNLTLERRLVGNWAGRITYQGVKTTQLLWTQNLNSVVASAQPFSQSRRPYPGLQNVNFTQNGANDRYHAMVLGLSHPLAKGIFLDTAYTYNHSKTTAPSSFLQEKGQSAYTPEYAYDRDRDAARSPLYTAHDFIANFAVDLPFGEGHRLGGGWSNTYGAPGKFLNAIAGNWSFVGVFSWISGKYFTPTLQGVDPGNLGATSGRRPDLVPGCDPTAGQGVHGLWFNPRCYTVPPAGQLGNVKINSLQGPASWVLNLSPYKEFPLRFLREGTKLRIGAYIYNILNHPVYGRPTSNLNSLLAGKITGTAVARSANTQFSGQRQFAFDMRIIF